MGTVAEQADGGGAGARVGIDVGGTFTDLVGVVGGRLVTAKVPSTPDDQGRAVLHALQVAAGATGPVAALAHGTTVATNALLERRGARTALVTTEGFRDLIEIGRQDRASLYDLAAAKPPPLVPRDLRITVVERMGPDGEVVALDRGSLDEAVAACRGAEVESVAVGLLFGYLHPDHEQQVAGALREALGPEVAVVASHEVLPTFREHERFATTTADAYLAPVLGRYLGRLAGALRDRAGLDGEALVMQSSGGVVGIGDAARRASGFVLSGPAGGVVGAARVAGASGHPDVLTFDMGGTSTDVAPVVDGQVATTTSGIVAGVPLGLPMVDVHTVSAGGGSIAWADEGGALRVGPRSAGADPGPAGYGRGGREPTVTDAAIHLGWLADGARLGGEVVLDRRRATEALARVGSAIDLDADACAAGVVRVAEAEMARALRVVSVERGLDPRRFALVAFGGAGGMHACSLAAELGIATVLVPAGAGVLSAYGLAAAEQRRDLVAPVRRVLDEGAAGPLDAALADLEAQARTLLPGADLARSADVRYRGQSFELTVDAGDAAPAELVARFHDRHHARLGYRMDGEPVEVVAVRVVATRAVDCPLPSEGPPPRPTGPDGGAPPAFRRRANVDGAWDEVEVLDRDRLGRGSGVAGPCIVACADTTVVVGAGWAGEIDELGTLVLTRRAAR